MNIRTLSRLLGIFALAAIFFHCTHSSAQPVGGKWTAVSQLPILTSARLVFADSMVGYYIGQDTGYITKDGALTWTQLTFPDNATPSPSYLFALSHNTVMAFQQRRLDGTSVPGVMISNDMGATWSVISSKPLPNKVFALTMWNVNDGFRIWLDDNSSKDTCAGTHDGGKTYTDIRGDATLEKYISKLQDGTFTIQSAWSDMLHGVIAVSGKTKGIAYPILLTNDGGKSWREQYLKFKGDSTIKFSYPYVYPGTGSIWVIPAVPLQAQFFYYSSDYGATWVTSDTLVKTGQYPPAVFNFAPVSTSASWVVLASDEDHNDLSRNVIGYKDISGKWISSYSIQGGMQNGFRYYWYIKDIQFTDQNHGWITAEKRITQFGSTSIVDTEFFIRFRITPQNTVIDASKIPNLRCSPNPASSMLKLEGFSGDERIRDIKIINTLGNQFFPKTENLNSAIALDVSGLSNGYYEVIINTSEREESIPVMILR